MKPRQLADRIGNIDDDLIVQAESAPNFGRARRSAFLRRMASAAAVLVLMVVSFTVGAVAVPREPEIIIEKEIVYVEIEQEIITIGDTGISLILPSTWAGQYVYVYDGSGGVSVHHRASFEDEFWGVNSGGLLFSVRRADWLLPMDYQFPWQGFVIASVHTDEGMVTYSLAMASDVQWAPQYMDEYLALFDDVLRGEIHVLLTDWMREHSTNIDNWVEGTVHVSFANPYTFEVLETVVMSTEQSRIIAEVIGRQDFDLPRGNWRNDMIIQFGGETYYFNSATGQIQNTRYYTLDAVMSAEDVLIIMDLFE